MTSTDETEARRRLQALVDKYGGPTRLGDAAGMSKSWISSVTTGAKPFRVAARAKLEDALNLPRGYFADEDGAAPGPGVMSLPVKTWDDISGAGTGDRVLVAKALSPRAFALLMDSDAMLSRSILDRSIPPGVHVIIEPDHAFGPGDDVLVQFEPGSRPCIRRVLVDGPTTYVKPLNQDYAELTKVRGKVRVLGRVMGMVADL